MKRTLKVASLGLALVLASEPANAQEGRDENIAKAKALATEAQSHAVAKDFDAALAKFRESYALHPTPQGACNLGSAHYALKQWPQAHRYLSLCLARTQASQDVSYYEVMSKQFAYTEHQLLGGDFGRVAFEGLPADAIVTVDVLPQVAFSQEHAIWLPSGTATLTASAPNHESDSAVVEVGANAQKTVAFELTPSPPKAVTNSSYKESSPVSSPTPALAPGPSIAKAQPASQTTLIYAGAALGLGAFAAGTYFALDARDLRNEQRQRQLPAGSEYDDLRERATRSQRVGGVFFIAGAAASIASLYLVLTRPDEKPSAQRISISPVGISSNWTF